MVAMAQVAGDLSESARLMPLAVGQSLSFYEILGPLGAGAMGEVYRAKDTRLDREVAIKVLPEHFADDEERLRRFEREAKSLASLNHPNVAQIHGVDNAHAAETRILSVVNDKVAGIEAQAQHVVNQYYKEFDEHPELRIFLDTLHTLGKALRHRATLIIDTQQAPWDVLDVNQRGNRTTSTATGRPSE